VLIALFADIHANRQAFEACLEHAHAQGAQRSVLLGDYVGYGADPGWTVDAVKDMVDKGAIAVLGNHDNAVNVPSETMNSMAQTAIEWTRGQLNAEQKAFLARLPLTLQDESRLYVHSEASKPREWIYVKSTVEAATSLASTPAHITFCGHIHQPALYSLSITAKMTSFTPTAGAPVPMLPGRRWLAVLGSVGQPRDGNPAAAYALLDTDKKEITYCRVPYDIDEAAARIRKAGLPVWLADRLLAGK
jgi:diadenosine tetraphosphatase ApaH/serine/threonine PP2A family protein phosphatase